MTHDRQDELSAKRYVLEHDGTWFYYLGRGYYGETFYADGEPMVSTETDGWFATDHEARLIEAEKKAHQIRASYKLVEGVPPSEKFPASLTVAEYDAKNDDESTEYEPRMYALYEAVMEDVPPVRTPVEGEWFRLEGEPPPKDGHTWHAKLPFELRYANEYRHLFPGYLEGFKNVLAAKLNKIPGVTAYDHQGFSVTIEIQWDKPPMVREKRRNDRKFKDYPARPLTERVKLRPPYRIDGSNRAAAVKEWDRLMDDYVGQVQDVANVKACGVCHGKGYRRVAE